MNDPAITLEQVLALVPGQGDEKTWINGQFDALVSHVVEKKARTGKPFWTVRLSDPQNPAIYLESAFFTHPGKFEGCICHFSGGGMVREEYNGAPKISCGKKTKIVPITGKQGSPAGPGAQGNAGLTKNPALPQANTPGPALNAPNASKTLECMKLAVGLLRNAEGGYLERSHLLAPEFSRDLHTVASDLLRVYHLLEENELADSAKKRAKGSDEPPPPKPAMPPAGPDGQAFPPSNGPLEDIPF